MLGINSARSFTHKSGWISEEQLLDVKLRVCPLPPSVFKVVVTHHPFIPPPREPGADVIIGAETYLDEMEACGVDMLLAGHLHLAYHDDLRSHYKAAKRSILSVQAGTATSTRRRGEPNAYNWITVSPDLCTVAVRAWCNGRFEESLVTRYRRVNGVWERESRCRWTRWGRRSSRSRWSVRTRRAATVIVLTGGSGERYCKGTLSRRSAGWTYVCCPTSSDSSWTACRPGNTPAPGSGEHCAGGAPGPGPVDRRPPREAAAAGRGRIGELERGEAAEWDPEEIKAEGRRALATKRSGRCASRRKAG